MLRSVPVAPKDAPRNRRDRQPPQIGPVGVMVGDYAMPPRERETLLKAFGGRLRSEVTTDDLVAAIEDAIASYRAWASVPNDEHFAQPREITAMELRSVRQAANRLTSTLSSLSDEGRMRLGERCEHAMLWQATRLRNRCDNALADLREEPRRRGPRPFVAERTLASDALAIFQHFVNTRPTYSGRTETAWMRFLDLVFASAGARVEAAESARKLCELERSRK
jgi:hypothetical protein